MLYRLRHHSHPLPATDTAPPYRRLGESAMGFTWQAGRRRMRVLRERGQNEVRFGKALSPVPRRRLGATVHCRC